MKANIITNVLLCGLIVLLIVCTAIMQQELRQSRDVMKQWLDKQPKVTVVETPVVPPAAAAPSSKPPVVTPNRSMPAPTPPAEQQAAASQAGEKSHVAPPPPPPPPPAEVTSKEPTVSPPPEAGVDDVPAERWAEYGDQVTGIIRDLLSGQYDAVIKQFNGEMKLALPKAQLASVMDAARQTNGAYREVMGHEMMKAPMPANLCAFVVTAATERGRPLVFTITLDDKGRIAGLYLR